MKAEIQRGFEVVQSDFHSFARVAVPDFSRMGENSQIFHTHQGGNSLAVIR